MSLDQTVTIELNGKEYDLKPTLNAVRKIQRRFGGLRGALESLTQLNTEHIAHIVAAGAGVGAREINDLEEDVFQEGAGSAVEQVSPFISLLLDPKGEQEGDDGKKDQPVSE